MRRTFTALIALIVWGFVAPVEAQNALTTHYRGRDVFPGVAYGAQDQPRIYTRPVPAPGTRLAFQFAYKVDASRPVRVEATLTTGGTELHSDVVPSSCFEIPGGYDCSIVIPETIRLAWAAISGIRVRPVDGLEPVLEASSMLAVQNPDPVPPPTCRLTMADGSIQTRPKGTAIGGYLTEGLQPSSVKIGQWRRDGWRVEWQFVPATGLMGAGSTDRIVSMMWCEGVPQ